MAAQAASSTSAGLRIRLRGYGNPGWAADVNTGNSFGSRVACFERQQVLTLILAMVILATLTSAALSCGDPSLNTPTRYPDLTATYQLFNSYLTLHSSSVRFTLPVLFRRAAI
eukprot:8071318-Pyramimonas_sp.AAC.1